MKNSIVLQKIKQHATLYYFLFLVVGLRYLLPPYLAKLLDAYRLPDLLFTLLSMGLIVFFLILKKSIPRPPILLIVAIYACLIVPTVWNHGAVVKVLLHSLQVILICILIDAVIRENETLSAFLRAVRDLTLLFFVANFILMYFLPNGIPNYGEDQVYPYHLFGNYNAVINYVMPGLCCSLLLDGMRGQKRIIPSAPTLVIVIGFLISALTVYFTATTLVCSFLLLLWALAYRKLNKRAFQIYALVLLLVALFELLFVIWSKGAGLLAFVAKIFNKPINLHGRMPLWPRMMQSALKKPIFGYGYQDYDTLQELLGNGWGSHNYLLDIFQQRGAVGLLALLILFVTPAVRGRKPKTTERTLYILVGTCCIYQVMMLLKPFYETEYLFIPVFYAVFSSFSRSRGLCFEQRYCGGSLALNNEQEDGRESGAQDAEPAKEA